MTPKDGWNRQKLEDSDVRTLQFLSAQFEIWNPKGLLFVGTFEKFVRSVQIFSASLKTKSEPPCSKIRGWGTVDKTRNVPTEGIYGLRGIWFAGIQIGIEARLQMTTICNHAQHNKKKLSWTRENNNKILTLKLPLQACFHLSCTRSCSKSHYHRRL